MNFFLTLAPSKEDVEGKSETEQLVKSVRSVKLIVFSPLTLTPTQQHSVSIQFESPEQNCKRAVRYDL